MTDDDHGSEQDVPARLIDVARMAGVSVATASRVVSGADKASAETTARVLDAVARLAYVPDSGARALALRRRKHPLA